LSASSVYLDSSALVKLVVQEPESDALLAWIDTSMRLSTCGLARTEVVRAVMGDGEAVHARAREVIRRLDVIALDDSLLDVAALLEPSSMRTLDAIHVAAALALGDDLLALVAYDRRLVAAAEALGLPTASPGL
jgi:predicted nucleic acid-binding protein